jgi:hypothetical protein
MRLPSSLDEPPIRGSLVGMATSTGRITTTKRAAQLQPLQEVEGSEAEYIRPATARVSGHIVPIAYGQSLCDPFPLGALPQYGSARSRPESLR